MNFLFNWRLSNETFYQFDFFKDFIFLREGEREKDRESERARAQVGGVAGRGRSGPPLLSKDPAPELDPRTLFIQMLTS